MRPLKAYIYLNHLINNFIYLKQKHKGSALAVIKADAYGHGAIRCAQALQGYADGFAVAFLEEALEIRNYGITEPIILLEGVFSEREYQAVDDYHLTPVIQNFQQLEWFFKHTWHNQTNVWIKLDTGMRRAGFMPTEFESVLKRLQNHPQVDAIIDITHFSFADELDLDFTQHQLDCFIDTTKASGNMKSICNSAGILYHPYAYQHISRIGIALYGLNPIPEAPKDTHLKPVMHLHSEVFSVKELKKGECIGYGGIFRAPYDMRVGLVACGYADGYPRLPSQDNPVWIDGVKSRIVGRVSMDMLSIELNREGQGIGSEVELWGEHVSVNEIAFRANTISYELLCHLKRANKIYLE
ncbi:alanine racemase [Neisseriaceae bacterium PsAf]|nr:alanine racemase [Neisseriaceae bacterium PsAf]